MKQDLNDIELRSEEVQEILTKVPNWMIRRGSLLFLILILLLLFISCIIKYPDIISCSATVTTEIPPEKVYAKITGKIEKILVKDQSFITQNTPIAVIENTANYKDVLFLKSNLDTLNTNTKFFYFPFDKLPVLYLGNINLDFANFENSYSEYILNKTLNPFGNERMANNISIHELQRRLQKIEEQESISRQELKLEKKDLERQKSLFGKGVISSQNFEAKKLILLKKERDFITIQSDISQIKEQISTANKEKTGIIINRTREEIKLFKNVIQSFNQLKTVIKNWEFNYIIKSNIKGKVSFLNYWSANQNVNKGDLMFVVIPKASDNYVVKVKAPSLNSGKLKIGQRVDIQLQNYPSEEYGVLNGKIAKISLSPNQEGLYLIDATLPNKLMTSYNEKIDFKNEMIGSAEIITEDLRLIERFFYQFKKRLER